MAPVSPAKNIHFSNFTIGLGDVFGLVGKAFKIASKDERVN